MFTCKNPIKRYPIPYAKTIYFGVVHASIPFKSKGQKFMNILLRLSFPLSDLYEFQLFSLMRTFCFFFSCIVFCMHLDASEYKSLPSSVRRTSFQIAVQLAYKNYLYQIISLMFLIYQTSRAVEG